MTDRVLVASDYTACSPVFTDGNEDAAACDEPPTVTITSRVSGEVLGSYTGAPVEGRTGVYSASLNASQHTAALDYLDLSWEGTAGGSAQVLAQTIEVVGGFYESIPNLRTISSLQARDVEQLRKFRAELEDKCEEARGTSYVRRCAIETFSPGQKVRLKHRHVSEIQLVTVDGVPVDPADCEVDPITRTVTTLNGGIWFTTSLVIAYVHGHPSPPAALVEACRIFVRAKVTRDASDASRNPSSVTNLATQEVFRFTTADPRYDRWTDIDEVNEKINSVTDERVKVG